MSGLNSFDLSAPPKLLYIDTTTASNYVHCMHKHDRILEILLVQAGTGLYCVENEQFAIESGDIVICNANSVHDQIPDSTHPYITFCIGMTDLYLPGLSPNCLIAPHAHTFFHQPAQFGEITALTHLIQPHIPGSNDVDAALCSQYALCLLTLLFQMIADEPQKTFQKEEPLLCQIKAYIDEHYSEDISLAQISAHFYISPYYLSHLFKRHFSYSVMQYVIRRRIGEAQSLLMRTRISVTDIAQRTGFSDASHFSKLFMKYVGMSPLEYRRYRSEKAGNDYY